MKNTDETVTKNTPRPKKIVGGAQKAMFRNPDDTTLSPEMIEFLQNEGFTYRWVRIIKNGMIDHERVSYYTAFGGSLITVAEIKKIDPSFLSGMKKYNYQEDFADEEDRSRTSSEGVRKGDLVLMKLPLQYVEYKRTTNENDMNERLENTQRTYTGQTKGEYNVKVTRGEVSSKSFYED